MSYKDMVMHFGRNPFFCLFMAFFAALFFLFCGCGADRAAQKQKAANLADMGNAMAAEGNARGGLQKLLEAAKLDPDNADIYQQTALVFRSLGDYPLSLKYFRRALELRPQFPEAVNNMGTVYLLMGDWNKAVTCFKEAAAGHEIPDPPICLQQFGPGLLQHGPHNQKAIENYETALRLSRSYAVVYLNLARLYERKGDLAEAEAN